MAIVQSLVGAGNGYKILTADSPTADPAGFDDITRRILFRGTSSELVTTFALGSLLSGSPGMYCIGPQGAAESLPGGHLKATIGYKGFLSPNARPTLHSYTVTTRETTLPIQSKTPTGNDYTSYAGPPWVPSVKNPKTNTYWRLRLIDQLQGVRLSGVSIGVPGTPPPRPPDQGNPPTRTIQWENLNDPLISYPNGWVLRDYQPSSTFAAGQVALYFWTAYFEYVQKFGP